jgi:hypothetical protein
MSGRRSFLPYPSEIAGISGEGGGGSAGSILIQDNGVVPGSGNAQITAISPSYTPSVTGKLLVIATISGSDATVDDPLSFQMVRNPVSTTGAPGGVNLGSNPEGESSHVGGLFVQVLSYTEVRPVGTAVTYGLSATSLAAHVLTGVIASFTIIELP